MTEEQFDELINLYLDNEIGRSDLGALKHVIKENVVRRRKFERACQLHQAARKALTSSSASESNNGPPAQRPAASTHRPSSSPRISQGKARDSVKNKQIQAHRNASVGVLAERQDRHGSASSVDLAGIKIETHSSKPGSGLGGASRNYSFFDSPIGILAGIMLTLVGAFGMLLVIRTVSPDTDEDPGKLIENSPITQLDGGYDPKAAEELAAEIKRKKAAATATDVLRARLYQSALTGQAASNTSPVDYFSSHTDDAPTGTLSGNTVADLQTSVDSTVPVNPVKPEGTNAAPVAQP